MNNDLTQHPPRSPRLALGGIVALPRFIDKVRALNEGTIGGYFSGKGSVVDEKILDFFGFNYDDFKNEVATGATDESLLVWIQAHGTKRSQEEIENWSKDFTGMLAKDDAPRHEYILGLLKQLNLDENVTTTFDWLDADDAANFSAK
jgi:hypothetical protein